ncbi:MAG: tRNA-(ms[2]io[6]A)-hydroxylase [Polyangiaceae bacterium]
MASRRDVPSLRLRAFASIAGYEVPAMFRLRTATSPRWLEVVLADFDHFLIDHAACERKASATALSLVAHYRDKTKLVSEMIDLACEELEHFRQVHKVMLDRGLTLAPDSKDPYVNGLTSAVRKGNIEYHLLDRLLVFGIVEARGTERFSMLVEALPPGELRDLYVEFTRAEARHHALFLRIARQYYPEEVVFARLDELLDHEDHVLKGLPLLPIVH